MTATNEPVSTASRPSAWSRFSQAIARGFRRYAEWLVGISWKKFFLLSVLLLIAAGVLSEIPPFSTRFVVASQDPEPGLSKEAIRAMKLKAMKDKLRDLDVRVDEKGVHVKRRRTAPDADEPKSDPGATDAPAPIPDGKGTEPETPGAHAVPQLPPLPAPPAIPAVPPRSSVEIGRDGVTINLPREATAEIRAAVEEAREAIRQAVDEQIAEDIPRPRVRVIRVGSYLPNLAFLFIIASMVIKIAYAGRVKAEVKAAEAQETADAESLKRQVVEARLAAMQAQVEPHFLFNTLASIDHLIEVDPARASTMQKNLIALLRASMPGMREAETSLGRELAVVRPYLEILRVRMGDRLQTALRISDGLNSADFPPMMLQSLVENAIKHGLEPKPEGGLLEVAAEVVHGKLEVSVTDTGVGFGRAATAGTGIGLSNIRERLKLLYGAEAELRIADHAPSGTRVTVVVPYRIANQSRRA